MTWLVLRKKMSHCSSSSSGRALFPVGYQLHQAKTSRILLLPANLLSSLISFVSSVTLSGKIKVWLPINCKFTATFRILNHNIVYRSRTEQSANDGNYRSMRKRAWLKLTFDSVCHLQSDIHTYTYKYKNPFFSQRHPKGRSMFILNTFSTQQSIRNSESV